MIFLLAIQTVAHGVSQEMPGEESPDTLLRRFRKNAMRDKKIAANRRPP
jgi:hypothetical protein